MNARRLLEQLFESLRGEYWIHQDGSLEFADGDVQDYGHEQIVIHAAMTSLASEVGIEREYGGIDMSEVQEAARARGESLDDVAKRACPNCAPDLFLAIAGDDSQHAGYDPREFAMQYWGWKWMRGADVTSWNLAPGDLTAIGKGVGNALEEEGFDPDEIENFKVTVRDEKGRSFEATVSALEQGRLQARNAGTWDNPEASKQQIRKIDQQGAPSFYKGHLGDSLLEKLARADTVDFEWDNDAMHDMEGLPVVRMAVSDLKWHFKKKFWNTSGKVGAKGGDLRPQQVLDDPAEYPEHAERILDADLSFPLHVWQNQAGKWIILDGLHRLAKAFLEGKEYVEVKKVPKGRKSEITEGGMSDMLRASRGEQSAPLSAEEGTIKYAGKMQTSWNFSNGVTVIGGLRPLNSGVKVEMIVSTIKGQGAAEAALRWLKERHGPIRPVSVLPDAKLFWKKMRLKGLCS